MGNFGLISWMPYPERVSQYTNQYSIWGRAESKIIYDFEVLDNYFMICILFNRRVKYLLIRLDGEKSERETQ